ncbi:DUF4369 domain-containing protein [Spongiimicrobium salis]|uniref:DUF4369 domain-containing protein n=1 Tax=Spongiimicrobium salis TaxID=1667022 RepID=UPI00374DC003
MKKILFVGLLSAFFIACSGDTANTMTVSGNIKGLKEGTLYLQHVPDTILVTLDSIKIDGDANFVFKTEITTPEVFYLYLSKKDNNAINDRIPFFGEPGQLTINSAWNTFDTNAKIEGSKTQKLWEEYQEIMTEFNKKSFGYMSASMDTILQKNPAAIDSLQKASDANTVAKYRYAINFALFHTDSHLAPYIAIKDIPDANITYLDSIYNSLDPNVVAAKYGKALEEHLKKMRAAQ